MMSPLAGLAHIFGGTVTAAVEDLILTAELQLVLGIH